MRAPRRRAAPPPAAPPPAAPPAGGPPPRFRRALLLGAAGVALPILLHALLLPVWGAGSTPLFVVFLLSLLPATGVAFVIAGEGVLRIGYAMCIAIGAPFLSLSLHEARILGAVPAVEAAAAPSHPAAAGFLLPQARPRGDLSRTVAASVTLPRQALRGASGSMTLRGRFTVVPVVGPDWTAGQPVPVVAVLDHGPDSAPGLVTSARWEEGRGVLRLLPDPLRDHAVREALRQAGLDAAPRMVVGRWVADPRWAMLEAASPLLWLLGMAVLGLSLVILSRHPRVQARLDPVLHGPATGGPHLLGHTVLQGVAALTLPSLLALALRHAEVDGGVIFLAIGFAVVPSLMLTLGGSSGRTPIGIVIAGVILVVVVPLAVAARGAGPDGTLPSLAGARWADVGEGLAVLGAGWLAWAALAVIGRAMEGRGTPRGR
jgi:hypothetical protein